VTPVYYTTTAFTTVYRTGEPLLTSDNVNWAANGYRMPTEAEWEFAALGGTKSTDYVYSGSDASIDVAWSILNSGNITHAAGVKAPNELGIYDMSGNVLEWCWDVYGAYTAVDQIDPKGPAAGNYHLLRGGSFDATDFNCRVDYRNYSYPTYRFNDLGFRCTKD
jgi:formylglycine-generating enzyme required for sulfatase activity